MKRGLNIFGFSKFQTRGKEVYQMKHKRGISPLIATVLILGFTVALAAVIMVWGQKFTTGMQKQTEGTANTQMSCAADVDFNIQSVCRTTIGGYTVTVENTRAQRIDGLIVRFYESADTVQSANMFAAGIGSYEVTSGVYTPSTTPINTVFIEAIPIVTIGGKQITCSANKQEWGRLDGPIPVTCT